MRVAVLCGVLLGCSSPATSLDDGGTGGDSTTLPPGALHVTVSEGSIAAPSPRVGDAVVFTDANGTQVVVTDANGAASAIVSDPATITHVRLYGGGVALVATSVYGARPGESIILRTYDAGQSVPTAPITVQFPQTGATSYQACSMCGCASSATSPITVPMSERCQTDPATLTLVAYTNAQATGYTFATTPYSASTGGSVTMPAQLSPPLEYSAQLTNVPSNVTLVILDFSAGAGSAQGMTRPRSTSESVRVAGWSGLPTHLQTVFHDQNTGEYQYTLDTTQGVTSQSFDLQSWLHPWLDEPSFDMATRTFHPITHGGGADGDLFMGDLTYYTTAGTSVQWTLFAAHPGDLVLPDLPPSVGETTPMTMGPRYSFVVSSDTIDGYAQARLDPNAMLHFRFVPFPTGVLRVSASPNAR